MYKAPIKLISSPPKLNIDGEIYKAIVQCGVSVDKDELIKALQYDHGQYDKGYADAKTEVAREIFEEIERILLLNKVCSDSGIYYEHDAERDITELKKKYTEEQI